MFAKEFFITMGREWMGIDRLRLDKFYMVSIIYNASITNEIADSMSIIMSIEILAIILKSGFRKLGHF